MSIQINRISVGAVGVAPGKIALLTTDSLSTITTAGYLGNNTAAGALSPLDIVEAIYNYDGTEGDFGIFTVSVSSGINTLVAWEETGKTLTDPTQPYVVTSPGSLTTGNILIAGDANGTLASGPVAGNQILTSAIVTPDVGANLIPFDITVGQAALASGGSVTLYASSGIKRYKVRSLQLNSGGTNFSGGSGDRLGQVTDGTTVYSLIPAATMQSLVNAQWGATALPNPASAAINTSTAAGASLVFKYSGGTLDYTAGSLVISGILQRVA